MFEGIIISIFCIILFSSVILGIPLVAALLAGMCLFWFYGRKKGFSFKELAQITINSSLRTKEVIMILILIGCMTGLWRASGTIAYIVTIISNIFHPTIIFLAIFLANSAVSFLIGTSFGTAASMGTICMAIANVMQVSPILAGGAVISGCYFGDRCSPLSSSAALVASATDTDLYANIKTMMITGATPFALSMIIYGLLGLRTGHTAQVGATQEIFGQAFRLSPWCFMPAALVLILALFRLSVKWNIGISILCAFLVGLFVQKMSWQTLLHICIWGFHPKDPSAQMLAGGGILSMANVIFVVLIASGYAGLFEKTGMTDGLTSYISRLAQAITPYGAVLVSGIVCTSMACNQSLPVLIISDLCKQIEPDKYKLARYIENSIIVLAGLIPWNLGITVPLATIGAPRSAIWACCYMYLIPICELVRSLRKKTNQLKKNND